MLVLIPLPKRAENTFIFCCELGCFCFCFGWYKHGDILLCNGYKSNSYKWATQRRQMPGYGFGGIKWPREPQWWQYLAQHWTQAPSLPPGASPAQRTHFLPHFESPSLHP